MRRELQILLGLAIASASTAASAEWTRTKVADFGFLADFPAQPDAESNVENGVKLTSYSAVADGAICLVVVGDYGHTVDPEVELPASRDGFTQGVKGSVTTQKRIIFPRGAKNLHALEFEAESPTFFFRSRIVIEGERVYQVAGGVPVDEGSAADLDRCVNGFSLIVK